MWESAEVVFLKSLVHVIGFNFPESCRFAESVVGQYVCGPVELVDQSLVRRSRNGMAKQHLGVFQKGSVFVFAVYWPSSNAPPTAEAWDNSIQAFRADLQAMHDLIADPDTNLFATIPHGDGQTILREALLVADHNAYHFGQLVVIRRYLGAWSGGAG